MSAITCEEALPLLHRAHDGEASEDERARLLAHEERCPACARAAQEIAEVSSLLRAALPRPLSSGAPAALAGRLRVERAREREWAEAGRIARRWSRAAALVAAALGVAAALTGRPARAPARLHAEELLSRASPVTADAAAEIALAPGRLR